MEVGPVVVLGLMWVVLNALRKGGSRPGSGTRTSSSNLPPRSRLPGETRSAAGPTRRSGDAPPLDATQREGRDATRREAPQLDATQREGSQLEQLFRELGRTLDQAGQQGTRPTGRTLPPMRAPSPAKLRSKGGSLAPTAEGQSLELDPGRAEPQVEDLDDEAERVVEQRRAAAEANLQPLSEADHRVFDERVRQEPADKTAVRPYTLKQLREAVVWREILGPPVSLRESSDW
jgi:hypothetical protein